MLAVNAPELVDANAEVAEEFDSSYIYLAAAPTSTGAFFFWRYARRCYTYCWRRNSHEKHDTFGD